MLTNQVFNLNKEHNDKRDLPIDEELYKGMLLIYYCVIFNKQTTTI